MKTTALLLTLGFAVTPTPQPSTTCCEKGNPPKCYQCYRYSPDLGKHYAQGGRYRCTVSVGGALAHSKGGFTSYGSCYSYCIGAAFARMQNAKGLPVTHACYPE
jgi:hypothetical protein